MLNPWETMQRLRGSSRASSTESDAVETRGSGQDKIGVSKESARGMVHASPKEAVPGVAEK
jgi:hypothetical protein